MNSKEIRQRFLDFFEKRGHAILPSASLVATDNPDVINKTLFNSAGVQPLIRYLLGKKHPEGTRLADVQKCLRTIDIDDVGDNTHATFFEMLGNWSLGDYFKEDAIKWSYEFLTSKEEGLGLDPKRLYVTVFAGDESTPKDEESFEIWKKYIPENRIYFLGAHANWWPNVKKKTDSWTGPTGPSTEMFYDLTSEGLGDMSHDEFITADNNQDVVEIWNDVFMEFEKKDGVITGPLDSQNVDTGAGLERITAVLQNVSSIFETDLFVPILEHVQTIADEDVAQRIIADHIRSSVFLISDGVLPSNTDQGYILRRLLRRAIFQSNDRNLSKEWIASIVGTICEMYGEAYQDLISHKDHIISTITKENDSFVKTLQTGIREFEKRATNDLTGEDAFVLFSTYGFPLELTKELAEEKNISVDEEAFHVAFKEHQEKSRSQSEQKFKGGLAGTGEQETRYHTATHLLHAALRTVLGDHVFQKGSNITADRLRFDFSYEEKMTPEQKEAVEKIVNDFIQSDLPVTQTDMPFEEAKSLGAIGLFDDKYEDIVSVYTIGDDNTGIASRELCGGPHVTRTGELGTFVIKKEESSSKGIRRIKAILEN